MDGDHPVRLGVLGETTATRDGVPLALGGRRQRAVLAALVMARGESVPADRLVECVWGEDPPANPSGTLQSYVSHLRRGLEPGAGARSRGGVIVSSGNGYALRLPTGAVDAWRFEQAVTASPGSPPAEAAAVLDAALRLWRGPAYAEYADEPWARADVARLTELREVARERLLGARLDAGEAGLVVGELEALVAEDPLREERWRLLVLGLYRAQRQADALAALRRARATLRDSLGVDPGPTLRALEREVLAQAPGLAGPGPADSRPAESRPAESGRAVPSARSRHDRSPGGTPSFPPAPLAPAAAPAAATPTAALPGAAPPGAAPPGAAPPGAAPPSPGLSEREDELRRLSSALGALAGGTGGLLLVQGPGGIGKTALLGATTALAAGRGLPVLAARCSRLEQPFGFGVVRQLLEPVLADDRRDHLLVAAGAARGVLDDPVDGSRAEGGFAVLHGLYRLTAALAAEVPLVLAVDDLHWCDSASLRYLAYLGRRLDGHPVLVAATVRTGEDHPEAALLHELALDPGTTVVVPRPLSRDAVRALVAERLGAPVEPFVAVCHTTTGGNPLLLRQLVRALESAGVRPDVSHVDTVRAIGSRAVSDLVMLRLRRMPAEATAVARAVAVLAQHADLPTVAAFADLDERTAAGMLDVLTRAEVLADRQPPAFVHPLVGDAVYHDQPAGERALHHERAARVLQRRGAALEHVATHLLLAPPRGSPETVALLRAAATTAADHGATESAVTLLRRAVEEPATGQERVDVLVRLGRVESLVAGPAAVAHLGEAYASIDDPVRRAETAVVAAHAHLFVSPRGTATAFARDAAAALPEGLDDARQALVALQRISGHMHGLSPEDYRVGRPEVSGDGPGARMLAAVLAFELLLDGEGRDEAVRLARFAIADDTLLAADNGLLWITAALVLLLADADLEQLWERATARGQRTGSLFAVLSVNLWRGFTEWRRGHLDDAAQSLADAVEQGRMWGGSDVSRAYATAFAAGVQMDRGDLDAAAALLRGTAGLPDVGEGTRLLREARIRLALERGRAAEALAAVEAVAEPRGIANPAWCGWRRLRAGALAAAGREQEALALADEEVALLRRWGAPSQLGAALRARGMLRAGGTRTTAPGAPGADAGAGLDDLREAVGLLSGTASALELGRACLELGRARGTSRADAVALLRRALDLARAAGAGGVQREAADALEVLGGPVPEACARPVGRTARHRQVLALAAQGLDAAEVARRMFLPVRTVETLLAEAPPPPSDAAPSDAAPSDAAPSDAAPSDAAPSDAAPSDAAPSDAAPSVRAQDDGPAAGASHPQVPRATLPPSRPWSTT